MGQKTTNKQNKNICKYKCTEHRHLYAQRQETKGSFDETVWSIPYDKQLREHNLREHVHAEQKNKFVCLFIWGLSSHLRIFHSYGVYNFHVRGPVALLTIAGV